MARSWWLCLVAAWLVPSAANETPDGRAVRETVVPDYPAATAAPAAPRSMDDERWSLLGASLDFAERSRSVDFFGRQVERSPLTLDRFALHGLHPRHGTLGAYSGFVSSSRWNPRPSDFGDVRAHGASYRVESGGLRVVPTVVFLPDSGTPVPGVVSVGIERAVAGDPLRAKAEYGWSGRAGGSFEVDYRVAGRHLALKGISRPLGFAALPTSRSPGSTLDGIWHENLGARTTAHMTLSASRLALDGREPDAASGRIELRHRTTDRWSVNAGVGASTYRDADAVDAADAAGAATALRRGTVSVGTAYDLGRVGLSATYRNEETSASAHGGHGGRVALRASHGGWRANLYADAQQQASTLELGLDDRPDLARAISDLGMVVASPDDAVRVLRDHGALFAQHGVTVGTLRLDPLRVQGGIDLAWRDAGARRTELGLRVALDEVHGYVGGRRAVLGNLYASWRMFGDTDLTASYASWSTQRDLSPYDSRTVVRFGLRTAL
jgi:hypothetical protein